MSKNVLIISASPRKGGNSDTLCEQFGDIQKNPTMQEAYQMGKNIC